MAKVKVKLFADCHVGGKIRKQGEIVEIAEEIATDFGELEVSAADVLKRLSKADLVVKAKEAGVETVPDSMTKDEIIALILK